LVFSQSAWIRNSCYPYAIFLQTVPIVAIAPLVITWFDYGFHSVVIISFVLSLFPIIANATTGMVTVDPLLADLFRLHNATRWQLLVKLRLPNAVPHIVTGAKTSSGLAVVGAIVGEFFVGPGMDRYGLGSLIQQKLAQLKTAEAFAALFASTALSVAIFAAVSYTGSWVLGRWFSASEHG
jgi:NitT/TauT family transport system permease protein